MSKTIDVLFVINQNTDLSYSGEIYRKNNFTSAVLLTTHYLFQNERQRISTLFTGDVLIHTFADFLSDNEMEYCDNQATEILAELYSEEHVRDRYNYFFTELSMKFKNKKVYENLNKIYNYKKIYFMSGLGISAEFWNSTGAIHLNKEKKRLTGRIYLKLKKILEYLKYLVNTQEFIIITDENKQIIFISTIKRLNLAGSAKKTKVSIKPYKYLTFTLKNRPSEITGRFIEQIDREKNFYIGTTIHEYNYKFLKNINREILIFVDGYHPPNYPRTYIDSYITGKFVPRDMFDMEWFNKHGKETIYPFRFVKSNIMDIEKCNYSNKITTVILVLNHAGDWTSLINRSDTDILLEAFCEIAQKIKDINFIIRTHPTMIEDHYEGKNSLKRIKDYVKWVKLKNLTVSDETLKGDINRGDLFISEYSQVLLDVFRTGKPGIICNLTKRRSFMKDYEELGFFHSNSKEELTILIEKIIQCPDEYIKMQRKAMERYNHLLELFYKNINI